MFEILKQDIRRNLPDSDSAGGVVTLLRAATLNSIHALCLIRLQLWCERHGLPTLFAAKPLFWLFKIEIGKQTRIGPGLRLPHPMNLIIAPQCDIGSNCDLYAGVRLVWSHGRQQGPKLGDHVFMGDGAKAVGAITIGDHAILGVSAVATKDIPAHATAAGIPARVLTTRSPDTP